MLARYGGAYVCVCVCVCAVGMGRGGRRKGENNGKGGEPEHEAMGLAIARGMLGKRLLTWGSGSANTCAGGKRESQSEGATDALGPEFVCRAAQATPKAKKHVVRKRALLPRTSGLSAPSSTLGQKRLRSVMSTTVPLLHDNGRLLIAPTGLTQPRPNAVRQERYLDCRAYPQCTICEINRRAPNIICLLDRMRLTLIHEKSGPSLRQKPALLPMWRSQPGGQTLTQAGNCACKAGNDMPRQGKTGLGKAHPV